MPLRDHFRPPVLNIASWEGFFGGWPALMCLQLNEILPEEYAVEPPRRYAFAESATVSASGR